MSKFPNYFVFLVTLLLSNLPAFGQSTAWQGKMKQLADALGELMPALVSTPSDPKALEKGAKALGDLSHDLKAGQMAGKLAPPSDRDPSLDFLSSQFSSQTHRAYELIKQGNVEYGKTVLRTATAYCIACHTRHENGPEFATFPLSAKADSLGKAEKAELFVATRQFDKGLATFRELIADSSLAKTHLFDWERSLRNALAISVRVKNDPKESADIVALALKAPTLPDFERNQLDKWNQAVRAWQKEPRARAHTESGQAAEMRRLLKEASAQQFYPLDRSAEIQYLRVAGAAHEILRTTQDSKLAAEALLAAGTAYEVLANPTFWTMHEFYYEACVRRLPHSRLARECYQRIEQALYFGYTGSGGTNIPGDAQELLLELKGLAAPKKQNSKGTGATK